MKKLSLLIALFILIGSGCSYKEVENIDIFTSPSTLYRQIAVYVDNEVTVRGVITADPTFCTQMACVSDENCTTGDEIECNSCSSVVFLQDEKEGDMVLLEGISCELKEIIVCNNDNRFESKSCDLNLEVGKFYEVHGILREANGEPLRLEGINKVRKLESFE